jgi:hypothetical protein
MTELKFPAHRAHLEIWEGTYRHIDLQAQEERICSLRQNCFQCRRVSG